jgi:hypothetical protein
MADEPVKFEAFPKIARWNRDIIVTEKIDGTNACVVVHENGKVCYAQSRKRFITPGKDTDNFGFAAWVYDNNDVLAATLGPGRHFGEWWGSGIGRGYGLQNGERVFSLFNTSRWAGAFDGNTDVPPELGVVPVLFEGPRSERAVAECLSRLRKQGSAAVAGYDRPEGVVIYHKAANTLFKVTLENDEMSKGEAEALARREQ